MAKLPWDDRCPSEAINECGSGSYPLVTAGDTTMIRAFTPEKVLRLTRLTNRQLRRE